MKHGELITFWPGRYLLSRVSDRRAWRSRRRLFTQRRPITRLAEWPVNAEKRVVWDEVLWGKVLRYIGDSLGIDWQKLRPCDVLDKELQLPSPKLHEAVVSHCYETLEFFLAEHRRLPEDLESPLNWGSSSVLEIMDYVQHLWHKLGPAAR